ncbi:MAG: YhjD/YihY/BrkB family envelope integrity protein [Actinomycetes bacterium]
MTQDQNEGKAKAKLASARAWAKPHVLKADESLVGRMYNRLLEIEFIDRSIALAAKTFIAFFPFLLGMVIIAPDGIQESVTSSLVDRFGLSGDSADMVRTTFVAADSSDATIGFFGLIMLILYATSFTTALQRIYLRAWRRPPGGGLRNNGRGLVWLAGIVMLVAINGTIGKVLVDPPAGGAIRLVLGAATSVLLWWWTAHTMLRKEVKWRPLLPGAIITGIGLLLYALSANIWMPRMVSSNTADFGFFGVSLSIVTCFVGVSFVVVIAAALGPTLSEGDGSLARWLRGPTDDVLNPDSPSALPGPSQRLRLASALGIGRDDEDDD